MTERSSVRGTVARYLEAAQARQAELNAYLLLEAEEALKAADASDARHRAGRALGPLDGFPIAIKDNIDVALLPTTNGTGFLAAPAREDAFSVRRLRAHGAVLLGKLNMDEAAFGASNDNPHFGRAVNPRRPGHVPGGSSGGAGVAVAAGLARAALGTDTLGSVRIPAAYCGVVGVKPTRGLVSTRGVAPLSPTLDTVGVLAGNIEDAARVLSALAAYDAACVGSIEAPAPFLYRGEAEPRRSVLGRPRQLELIATEPAVAQAFERALTALAARGFRIVELDLADWQPEQTRRAGLLLIEAEAAVVHGEALAREDPALSEAFRAMLRVGRDCGTGRLVDARRTLKRAAHALRRALRELDALVLPTTPQRAFPFDGPRPRDQTSFVALANAGGAPAASLPLRPQGPGELPAGLQLVGRPFTDGPLLDLAAAVERALAEMECH